MANGFFADEEIKCLQTIIKAADSGDKEADAWLSGKGCIVLVSEKECRFKLWEDVSGRNSALAVEWRRKVFERDGYKCVECGSRGRLQAHHIKPWADFIELRFDVDNGITLCINCHAAKHPGMERLIKKAKYHKGGE